MGEPLLDGKAALMANPLCQVSMNGKYLENVFADIPNSIYRAANLNLTFDDTYHSAGLSDSKGIFDGVIGLLQRNESDFAVFSVPLESLQGNFDIPVKVITLMDKNLYRVISSPRYNRSMSEKVSDINDSYKLFSPFVVVLYFFLFIFIHTFIKKFSYKFNSNQSLYWARKKEISKPEPKIGVAFQMSRYFLRQGIEVHFNSPVKSVLFFTFGSAVGIIVLLFTNCISADLVTYAPPKLLNTLEDVWAATEEGFKISFIETSGLYGIFKSSPIGSIENKLYERSCRQWKSKKGTLDDLQLMSSKLIVRGADPVVNNKIAVLSSPVPISMLVAIECATNDLPHSVLHVSDSFFKSDNRAIVASRSIDARLERRLAKYHTRQLESGLQMLSATKAHEWTVVNLFGMSPRMQCMNSKVWSGENDKHTSTLRLKYCAVFLFNIAMLSFFSIMIFVIEIWFNYFALKWELRNGFIVPLVYRERIFADPNKCPRYLLEKRRGERRFEMFLRIERERNVSRTRKEQI